MLSRMAGLVNGKAIEFIEGPILVRPHRTEDVRALFTAARESVKELSPWLPWCHENYAIEETSAFILSREEAWKAETEYGFGIFEHRSGRLLGGVGINQINRLHSVGNLGYWIRSTATGHGVATTAARLVARFGFEQLGLRRIEILVALGNHASQRVAEKCGATREGVLRKRLLIRGESQDAVIYSLVREDIL
jgi:ribosomal-protein-serine acetyltransferase